MAIIKNAKNINIVVKDTYTSISKVSYEESEEVIIEALQDDLGLISQKKVVKQGFGKESEVDKNQEEISSNVLGEKEDVFLFLFFYIDEDHKGKHMISESCQTRLKNLKKISWYDGKKYKAFSIPIQSVDEILEQIPIIVKKHSESDTKRVVMAEIGVFSHAAGDGPISYNKEVINCPISGWPQQMDMCGWEQIDVLWSPSGKCVFYGCNTGNPSASKNFAQNISNLSNFKDVEVWGQSTSSFPSFYPDYRVTSAARSIDGDYSGGIIENGLGWDIRGNTYQVAGNKGEGKKSISYRPDKSSLTEEELKKGGYPKANVMNCYKNGTLIKSSHQGVFNDHR
ncbi:hypothetical protein [Chryseobacterium echinoideorum]|uniref:hypothetical protein n=1 Tax=Chryseobacterium echinoideorum TaxID=1549648 RepID=UPI001184D845|nr:hypothetical protein [Chryseobacterium echinoideorum]